MSKPTIKNSENRLKHSEFRANGTITFTFNLTILSQIRKATIKIIKPWYTVWCAINRVDYIFLSNEKKVP